MKSSDWIQVIAICLTLIVSVISIVQSNRSIKLTEKTIEESNRPYVSAYVDIVDTTFFAKYLVLKNFGNTMATISKLTFEGLEEDQVNRNRQMKSLVGGSIAPNQKFSTAVEPDFRGNVIVQITYSDTQGKTYKDIFHLYFGQTTDMMWQKDTSKNRSEEAKAINNAAHAIVKTLK
ncbi:hypothetical protein PNB82_08080 [Enterococcus faecium]|uniref:hypothetical protein n=1 Tax=Enterococcus lactis TaxID=357441 RepID=UPI0022E73F09|nr:hypothetical protein [Enterococcus lactis]MDB7361284.1 hypothetical protein [Enterococcus faecium]MDB7374000.1 hypothetical protein [Enterococcus faecium]MDB7382574.1 hypothetical protein [Enterococcus faecium]MDB7397261.1 hypothetical protein [Enterococcus faecium]MDB7562530.1 hypothetical protein [Enterococcus faecium]